MRGLLQLLCRQTMILTRQLLASQNIYIGTDTDCTAQLYMTAYNAGKCKQCTKYTWYLFCIQLIYSKPLYAALLFIQHFILHTKDKQPIPNIVSYSCIVIFRQNLGLYFYTFFTSLHLLTHYMYIHYILFSYFIMFNAILVASVATHRVWILRGDRVNVC